MATPAGYVWYKLLKLILGGGSTSMHTRWHKTQVKTHTETSNEHLQMWTMLSTVHIKTIHNFNFIWIWKMAENKKNKEKFLISQVNPIYFRVKLSEEALWLVTMNLLSCSDKLYHLTGCGSIHCEPSTTPPSLGRTRFTSHSPAALALVSYRSHLSPRSNTVLYRNCRVSVCSYVCF